MEERFNALVTVDAGLHRKFQKVSVKLLIESFVECEVCLQGL